MYFTKQSNKLLLSFTFVASVAQFFYQCQGFGTVYEDLLQTPQYEVVIKNNLIPESTVDMGPNKEEFKSLDKPRPSADNEPAKIMMRNYLGDRFLCTVPTPPPPVVLTKSEQDTSRQDLDKVVERGLDLLNSLKADCLYIREKWWTYQYCHQKYVVQYHQEAEGEADSSSTYVLGKYEGLDKKTPTTSVKSSAGKKYLTQRWAGGTICDLNGKPRMIEVKFYCNPSPGHKIIAVKETSTCNYDIIIHTSSLCNDPLFADEKALPHHIIQCDRVVTDGFYQLSQSAAEDHTSEKLLLEQSKDQALNTPEETVPPSEQTTTESAAAAKTTIQFNFKIPRHGDRELQEEYGKLLFAQINQRVGVKDPKDKGEDSESKKDVKTPQIITLLADENVEGKAESGKDDHFASLEQKLQLLQQFLNAQGAQIKANEKQEQPPKAPPSQRASKLEKMYQMVYNQDEDQKKDEPKTEL
ncbi:Protein OS-9 [Basidiobolus ranarum]|uniref:Protein OS-9 homolog n=1 Tax=Basidiobolus ranarum TaxID=34480 RepID=A0ABR2X3G1_9FUNG